MNDGISDGISPCGYRYRFREYFICGQWGCILILISSDEWCSDHDYQIDFVTLQLPWYDGRVDSRD
jgi:hypothetical protein